MKIVFATNNQHKLSEIRSILGETIEVLSLKDINCDVDIPETGKTLEEKKDEIVAIPYLGETRKEEPNV